MVHLHNQRVTEPCAYVTKGRQRVKQYSGHGNGSVYLNNGDEFEIELFNPTSQKILAEVLINGKTIGTSRGIVLRPGERVFLERYLDESKKFRFETYEVNGADPNVQRAIAENGNVEVKFYCEQTYTYTYWGTGGTVTLNDPWWSQPSYYYCNTTPSPNFGGGTSSSITNASLGNASYTSSCNFMQSKVFGFKDNDTLGFAAPAAGANFEVSQASMDFAPMETGRVEKGSNSNQHFGYDYSNYNTFWSWKTSWKILPMSQKPYETEDIKVFCTKCGMKRKRSSHNFCPKCGTKY